MRVIFIVAVCISSILTTACGGSTVNNNASTAASGNANPPANLANENRQPGAASPNDDAGPTPAQQQLSDYVKQFLSKPIPQKLSGAPLYQEKVAAFRKEGDNYVYLPPNNAALEMLKTHYTESSSDLKTIIVIDPQNASFSAIDMSIPAVVFKKKVNVARAENEQDAEYLFIVELGKLTYNINQSLNK